MPDDLTTLVADALFDCYRGYNDETIARLKMMSQYQREAQAARAVEALRRAGYKITKTE